MVRVIQNFAKKDCVHFQTKEVPSCCGRTHQAGVCTIEYRGTKGIRTCSTKMKWCRYEFNGGAQDVHSEKL